MLFDDKRYIDISSDDVIIDEEAQKTAGSELYSRFALPTVTIQSSYELINDIRISLLENVITNIFGKKYTGKTSLVCQAVDDSVNLKYKPIYIDLEKGDIYSSSSDIVGLLKILSQKDINDFFELLYYAIITNNNLLFIIDGIKSNSAEYLEYEKLLNRLNDSTNISHIVLISDALFKCDVKKIEILGISIQEVKSIFALETIEISDEDAHKINNIYSGIPAYIIIAAEYCQRYCGGNINLFLNNDSYFLNGVEMLIDHQYESLQDVYRMILDICVLQGRSSHISQLIELVDFGVGDLSKIIDSLVDRNFLICSKHGEITFLPLMYDYCRKKFIEKVCDSLFSGDQSLLRKLPLLKNRRDEKLREYQNILLGDIIKQLEIETMMDDEQLYSKLMEEWIHKKSSLGKDYFAGNLLNIILHIQREITNADFSNTYISECDLSNAELFNVDFSNTEFDHCIFTNVFGSVTAIAYSPFLNVVATSFFSGLIIVWNLDGEQVAVISEYDNVVYDLKFYNNSLWAAGKNGVITHWKFDEQLMFEFCNSYSANNYPIRTIVASLELHRIYAGSEDGNVYSWNIADEYDQEILCSKNYRIKSIAISTDGCTLAIAGDSNEITFVELLSKAMSYNYVENRWIRCLSFYSNDILLCGGDSGNINIVHLNDGTIANIANADKNKVWSIAPLREQYCFAAGCDNGEIRIYEIKTEKLISVLHRHTSWVRCMDASGKFVFSGGEDQTICFWNCADFSCFKNLKGYTKRVFSVDTFEDQLVAGLGDHSVCIVDADKSRFIKLFTCSDQVWTIAVSSNLICAGCDKGDIYIFDKSSKQMRYQKNFGTGWIGAARFSSSGDLLAVGDEQGFVYIFNTKNKHMISQSHKYRAHDGRVSALIFWGETILSSGEDGKVCIFNYKKRSLIVRYNVSSGLIYAMAVDNCGNIITGDSKGVVNRINTDGRCQLLADCQIPVWSVVCGEKNDYYVGLDNGEIRRYQNDNILVCISQEHDNQVWSLKYSSDQKVLISGGEDSKLIFHHAENLTTSEIVFGNLPFQGVNIHNCKGISLIQKNYLCMMGAEE